MTDDPREYAGRPNGAYVKLVEDRINAALGLHPVEAYQEFGRNRLTHTIVGCPACSSEGPCKTRAALLRDIFGSSVNGDSGGVA